MRTSHGKGRTLAPETYVRRWVRFFTLAASVFMLSSDLLKADQSDSVYAGRGANFVRLLEKSEFAAASEMLNSTVLAALPPEKLGQVWNSIITQSGPLQRMGDVRLEKQGIYVITFIPCIFEQVSLEAKIAFDGDGLIAGLFFIPAQSVSKPSQSMFPEHANVKQLEVTVGSGEWKLPGTLTIPNGKGPFPAVVLVHGSGMHDRNETIGPNKPFLDLAIGLSLQGIAVLRYEKRTREHASKLAQRKDSITIREECVDDALAAVALLKKNAAVDAGRTFVLGHSLGGTLLPLIGKSDRGIVGLIVLAGATRPLEDVILDQIIYLSSLDSARHGEKESELIALRRKVQSVKQLKSGNVPASELPLNIPAAYWLSLKGYDPAKTASTLRQRMLILQGERDYQVTMADFRGWKSTLGGKKNVTMKSYPALNHLFFEGEGKSTPKEYSVASHVSPTVIQDIADWIKAK